MNTPRKISRRLDAARSGKYDVQSATDKEIARVFRYKPVLLKESAHVASKRKAKK